MPDSSSMSYITLKTNALRFFIYHTYNDNMLKSWVYLRVMVLQYVLNPQVLSWRTFLYWARVSRSSRAGSGGGCGCRGSCSCSSLADWFADTIEFAWQTIEEPISLPTRTSARGYCEVFELQRRPGRIQGCPGLRALLDCSQHVVRTARLVGILNHVLACNARRSKTNGRDDWRQQERALFAIKYAMWLEFIDKFECWTTFFPPKYLLRSCCQILQTSHL